jgi:hypothetical protein
MKYILILLLLSSCAELREDPKPGELWEYSSLSGDGVGDGPSFKIVAIKDGWVLYTDERGNGKMQSTLMDFKRNRIKWVDRWKNNTLDSCESCSDTIGSYKRFREWQKERKGLSDTVDENSKEYTHLITKSKKERNK